MADGSDITERLRDIIKWTDEQRWCAFTDKDVADLREAADLIERLRERLEMTHAWRMIDGKMTKVAVEPGSIPDGIECRDETIKLQDKVIERLRAQAPGWRTAMEAAACVADEAATHEREEIIEARKTLGTRYDHNSYGAGYDNGSLATAENIAEAIRALPSPPAEGGK